MYIPDYEKVPIRSIGGIGEYRAKALKKLGIVSVSDLLNYLPRTYDDRSVITPIDHCVIGETVTVCATVEKPVSENRIRAGMTLFKTTVCDESGRLHLTFFNQTFIKTALSSGKKYFFHGKIGGLFTRLEMASPVYELVTDTTDGRIVPIYPLTAGISSKIIENSLSSVFKSYDSEFDPIPADIIKRNGLVDQKTALFQIHKPDSLDSFAEAKKRLVFEELFILQLGLTLLKKRRESLTGAVCKVDIDMSFFYSLLPFSLTSAQLRCVNEIIDDLKSLRPMNRLLEGDVGTGKTVVAAAAIYYMVLNGYQCALMAPTEILAEQHFRTLTSLLEKTDINIAILTGGMPAKAKKESYARIKNGKVGLIVGTHALIQSAVEYNNLGFIITDEQHRFGVSQRSSFSNKGNNPHALIMSATPIPRTLALVIYGDLDLSIVDEYPAGRHTIDTFLVNDSMRERINAFIRKHMDEGSQVFIVCPAIDENETFDIKPVNIFADELAKYALKGYNVGVVHGRMSSKEKDEAMLKFLSNETQTLVSTTVIEVGVDVPNATLMIIENAERFGLSQLHQLRGRVGRGSKKSYCVLFSDSNNDDTVKRLKSLVDTNDGFKIAEYDLQFRGSGDFFGSRQHGLPNLKVANMLDDVELLKKSGDEACFILDEDPTLEMKIHDDLRDYVEKLFTDEDISFN